MNCFSLFTDVSLNPKLKLGVGVYLVVPFSFQGVSPDSIKRSKVAELLVLRRFEHTSSTKLEIQTILWAIEDYRKEFNDSGLRKLHVYSDSQCVAGLLRRRPRLEANDFHCKKTNRLLKNTSFYRRFYKYYDELGFDVIKVAGHTRSNSHDPVQRIFSFVDKEVRKALNLWMRELEVNSCARTK